ELLRVKGLFDTGSNTFDRTSAYSSIPCVQRIGVIKGDHEVVIKLPQVADLNKTNARLQSRLGEIATDLRLTIWKEAVPALASMISFNEATLFLISLVLF